MKKAKQMSNLGDLDKAEKIELFKFSNMIENNLWEEKEKLETESLNILTENDLLDLGFPKQMLKSPSTLMDFKERENDPFKMKTDLKRWLTSSGIELRKFVLEIENGKITNLIMQMYKLIQRESGETDGEFALRNGELYFRKFTPPQNLLKVLDKRFQSSTLLLAETRITTITQFLDTMILKFSHQIPYFFRLLDQLSKNRAFLLPPKINYDKQKGNFIWQYPKWFKISQFHSIGLWIAANFERVIWMKYFLHLHNSLQNKKFFQFVKQEKDLIIYWSNTQASEKDEVMSTFSKTARGKNTGGEKHLSSVPYVKRRRDSDASSTINRKLDDENSTFSNTPDYNKLDKYSSHMIYSIKAQVETTRPKKLIKYLLYTPLMDIGNPIFRMGQILLTIIKVESQKVNLTMFQDAELSKRRRLKYEKKKRLKKKKKEDKKLEEEKTKNPENIEQNLMNNINIPTQRRNNNSEIDSILIEGQISELIQKIDPPNTNKKESSFITTPIMNTLGMPTYLYHGIFTETTKVEKNLSNFETIRKKNKSSRSREEEKKKEEDIFWNFKKVEKQKNYEIGKKESKVPKCSRINEESSLSSSLLPNIPEFQTQKELTLELTKEFEQDFDELDRIIENEETFTDINLINAKNKCKQAPKKESVAVNQEISESFEDSCSQTLQNYIESKILSSTKALPLNPIMGLSNSKVNFCISKDSNLQLKDSFSSENSKEISAKISQGNTASSLNDNTKNWKDESINKSIFEKNKNVIKKHSIKNTNFESSKKIENELITKTKEFGIHRKFNYLSCRKIKPIVQKEENIYPIEKWDKDERITEIDKVSHKKGNSKAKTQFTIERVTTTPSPLPNTLNSENSPSKFVSSPSNETQNANIRKLPVSQTMIEEGSEKLEQYKVQDQNKVLNTSQNPRFPFSKTEKRKSKKKLKAQAKEKKEKEMIEEMNKEKQRVSQKQESGEKDSLKEEEKSAKLSKTNEKENLIADESTLSSSPQKKQKQKKQKNKRKGTKSANNKNSPQISQEETPEIKQPDQTSEKSQTKTKSSQKNQQTKQTQNSKISKTNEIEVKAKTGFEAQKKEERIIKRDDLQVKDDSNSIVKSSIKSTKIEKPNLPKDQKKDQKLSSQTRTQIISDQKAEINKEQNKTLNLPIQKNEKRVTKETTKMEKDKTSQRDSQIPNIPQKQSKDNKQQSTNQNVQNVKNCKTAKSVGQNALISTTPPTINTSHPIIITIEPNLHNNNVSQRTTKKNNTNSDNEEGGKSDYFEERVKYSKYKNNNKNNRAFFNNNDSPFNNRNKKLKKPGNHSQSNNSNQETKTKPQKKPFQLIESDFPLLLTSSSPALLPLPTTPSHSTLTQIPPLPGPVSNPPCNPISQTWNFGNQNNLFQKEDENTIQKSDSSQISIIRDKNNELGILDADVAETNEILSFECQDKDLEFTSLPKQEVKSLTLLPNSELQKINEKEEEKWIKGKELNENKVQKVGRLAKGSNIKNEVIFEEKKFERNKNIINSNDFGYGMMRADVNEKELDFGQRKKRMQRVKGMPVIGQYRKEKKKKKKEDLKKKQRNNPQNMSHTNPEPALPNLKTGESSETKPRTNPEQTKALYSRIGKAEKGELSESEKGDSTQISWRAPQPDISTPPPPQNTFNTPTYKMQPLRSPSPYPTYAPIHPICSFTNTNTPHTIHTQVPNSLNTFHPINPFNITNMAHQSDMPCFTHSNTLSFNPHNLTYSNIPTPSSLLPSPIIHNLPFIQNPPIHQLQPSPNQEKMFYLQISHDAHATMNYTLDFLACQAPLRQRVFDQLSLLIKNTFLTFPIEVQMYGSMKTGLALESSDMDIGVFGINIITRDNLFYFMTPLYEKLNPKNNHHSFIINSQYITTARVPVIKLVIDINKLLREDESAFTINNELKVDITFDHQDSDGVSSVLLGVNSTHMVQYFIHQHKHLKPILILLKKLLTKHQLNIPYHGGLNSYSLVLMCVSFFNSHPQYQILGENLIYFLKYYGSEYDFSEFAIFYDGQIITYVPLRQLAMHPIYDGCMILDPLNPNNNIAANAYRIKDIQICFYNIYQQLLLSKRDYYQNLCDFHKSIHSKGQKFISSKSDIQITEGEEYILKSCRDRRSDLSERIEENFDAIERMSNNSDSLLYSEEVTDDSTFFPNVQNETKNPQNSILETDIIQQIFN